MNTPKINGLPSLPEGHEFLMEGEGRREEMKFWSGSHWAKANGDSQGCPIMSINTFYCAPIRKSYAERQDEWIAKHGIKKGSKVRVTRVARDDEGGWPDSWSSGSMVVGDIREVEYFFEGGVRLCNGYSYPYFVLEPVADEIAPGHNPDKVTVSQVGEGFRLMTKEEISDPAMPYQDRAWIYNSTVPCNWIGGCDGNLTTSTYRVPVDAKPRQPKRVPLEEKDWEGGPWWIRKSKGHPVWMVIGFRDCGIYVIGSLILNSTLEEDNWQRSRDCINWEPCDKEVEG